MALVIADRVRETSTTTGTGTLTLGGAVAGYQTFSSGIGNGNTCYYAITLDSDWEVGIGTYTASGTTLSRDTVLASSNAGSAVNFGAGTKDVFATYPAGRAVYKESGGNVILDVNSTSAALRITQTGSGNALVVEDSTSPDSTPFVVDASGRVITGGTAAYAINTIAGRIQSQSSSVFDGGFSSTLWSNDNSGAFVSFGKSRSGAVGTQTVVQANDSIGVLQFAGSDGTAFIEAARILAVVDGTPGTNDMPGRLVFSTTADGASTPTERMRIDNAGRIGIGVSNQSPANGAFRIGQSLTGSVDTIGVNQVGTAQSDVTTAATGIRSAISTAAASFTLASIRNFVASQGTIGAGSTVANQYGFVADTTLTGAANNFGFYSNIAAATGRWNFYANGTAANYFAGSTTFADATAPVISAKIGPSSSQQHTLPAVTSDTVTLNAATQTLTNKTLTTPGLTDPVITGTIQEDIFTLTDGATVDIDPGNGSIQTLTLAGTARTLTYTNMANGEAVTLMINDGTAGTITTWNATFVNNGAAAPTLSTTAYTVVVVWKVGGVVYAAVVGNA